MPNIHSPERSGVDLEAAAPRRDRSSSQGAKDLVALEEKKSDNNAFRAQHGISGQYWAGAPRRVGLHIKRSLTIQAQEFILRA